MGRKGEATRERIVAAAERLVLARGFAGTSLDDVLTATGLTKGAFFHHFKGKDELARAIVERYAAADNALFVAWSEQADAESEDPLRRVLTFLRLFEDHLDGLDEPLQGCVFAAYPYERGGFAPAILDYVREQLLAWRALYEAKLEALIAARPPARPVDAAELAELIVTVIEGGFVMAKALEDRRLLQRQSRQLRLYLELLFAGGEPREDEVDALADARARQDDRIVA